MAVKDLKPFNSSSRGAVLIDYSTLWKGAPEKSLLLPKKSHAGRNNAGRITVRHKGGRHKVRYRLVDFRRLSGSSASPFSKAIVERVEYDPNRTAFIALIRGVEDGVLSYIIAPEKVKKGDVISAGLQDDVSPGSCMKLEKVPLGAMVHNIELKPGAGGQIARSAGVSACVVARDGNYTLVTLPSGEKRLILSACHATIGVVSNSDKKNVKLGKAGRSRWLGIRPSVRGVAMNPVDHPLGGGSGKTSGGRHPVSPWGFPTKGKKTRNPNKLSSKFIKSKKR
ncbi:ribosomal protein L2 [Neorickettsia helminthoeca str. Oregon]|uniref:Large ribosomal subunit protein uL2 n=1 Tax=Neorickettsia helminthoeca str. Oregon TaxID=1286528 RepID=X5H3D7_9RICK|nr:50S ribosomal protein L2 [Neorickettsia helminthoeca]AHX11213.1 ribosomal protein L2 [Neorickettsia helminthoeca str. Oregon]